MYLLFVVELLTLIRETENDDLTTVLQKFVCTYVEEIMPLAVEITSHLVCFGSVIFVCVNEINMTETHIMTKYQNYSHFFSSVFIMNLAVFRNLAVI